MMMMILLMDMEVDIKIQIRLSSRAVMNQKEVDVVVWVVSIRRVRRRASMSRKEVSRVTKKGPTPRDSM
jgi:hypothetical protein